MEITRLLWRLWSPNWAFEEATLRATAPSLDNPDFVAVTIQSYRHRYGNAPGDPAYDALEARLAAQPLITVPTIILHGEDDGVGPPAGSIPRDRLFTAPDRTPAHRQRWPFPVAGKPRRRRRGGRRTRPAQGASPMKIVPSGQTLGARIEGIDLSKPLSRDDYRGVLRALGQYGVLCFPDQKFETPQPSPLLRKASATSRSTSRTCYHEPDFPEIMILSNMMGPDGNPLGLNDAGQGWHTDMSYSKDIALANILHARAVPHAQR